MPTQAYRENFKAIEWKPFPEVARPAPVNRRSSLVAPAVIGDTMEPTQHMADGKFYTSKSKFRAATRAHNCVEVGNDPARLRPFKKPKPDKKAIRDTIQRAKARFERGERVRPV